MTVRERCGRFQADVMLSGTRLRGTFDTHAEAAAFELQARAAHKAGKPLPEPAKAGSLGTTVADIFAVVSRKRWAHHKSANGTRDGNFYVQFCGPNMPASQAFTEDQVEAYVEHVLEQGVTGRTVNRRLASVSAMLKEAVKQGHASRIDLPWQPNTPGRIRWYTAEELADIYRIASGRGPEWEIFFRFLATTGARRGEALRLKWSEVRGRQVLFLDTKNGADRSVHTTDRTHTDMEFLRKRYGSLPGPFHWITPHSLRTMWDWIRGRLPWMDHTTVIHTFRHTCASHLIQNGVDQLHVQRWLGHKSSAVTARYMHLAPRNFAAMANVLESSMVTATGIEPACDKPSPLKMAGVKPAT